MQIVAMSIVRRRWQATRIFHFARCAGHVFKQMFLENIFEKNKTTQTGFQAGQQSIDHRNALVLVACANNTFNLTYKNKKRQNKFTGDSASDDAN
jgi:hypothetical protein